MSHFSHLHGVHPANTDGVFEMISPGGEFTYEFTAEPFGVFPYHCHMTPLEEHISRGLYGVFIVDQKIPRAPADEMVMVMNGYDTDFDTENNFYTVNGIPYYYYMHHRVQIQKDKTVRIYLVNMLEFDPLLSLTAGLLVFLGIDALLEVNEIVIGNLASVFNGQALSVLVTISSFVVLLYTSERLTQRAIEKS